MEGAVPPNEGNSPSSATANLVVSVNFPVSMATAPSRIMRHRPDADIDISLPIVDGWEVARILKSDPATAHIPVVAVTANAFLTDRQRAENVGCDTYLAKPCSPRDVIAAVQRYLGPQPEQLSEKVSGLDHPLQ